MFVFLSNLYLFFFLDHEKEETVFSSFFFSFLFLTPKSSPPITARCGAVLSLDERISCYLNRGLRKKILQIYRFNSNNHLL